MSGALYGIRFRVSPTPLSTALTSSPSSHSRVQSARHAAFPKIFSLRPWTSVMFHVQGMRSGSRGQSPRRRPRRATSCFLRNPVHAGRAREDFRIERRLLRGREVRPLAFQVVIFKWDFTTQLRSRGCAPEIFAEARTESRLRRTVTVDERGRFGVLDLGSRRVAGVSEHVFADHARCQLVAERR